VSLSLHSDERVAHPQDRDGVRSLSCTLSAILTFGPDGMTGHDDHRAIQTEALRALVGEQSYREVIAEETFRLAGD
jgi:hypothetical protein